MKAYRSLFKLHKDERAEVVFAHFYPIQGDYDEPFRVLARSTMECYKKRICKCLTE